MGMSIVLCGNGEAITWTPKSEIGVLGLWGVTLVLEALMHFLAKIDGEGEWRLQVGLGSESAGARGIMVGVLGSS